MMRATVALIVLIPAAFAAAPTDVLDFVSAIAGDLANNDVHEFLKNVDRAMPGYAVFKEDVESLLSTKDVESEIELISDQGDERNRVLELDWVLITRDKDVINGRQLTRRVRVKCSIKRMGKTWKLAAFDPLRLFQP